MRFKRSEQLSSHRCGIFTCASPLWAQSSKQRSRPIDRKSNVSTEQHLKGKRQRNTAGRNMRQRVTKRDCAKQRVLGVAKPKSHDRAILLKAMWTSDTAARCLQARASMYITLGHTPSPQQPMFTRASVARSLPRHLPATDAIVPAIPFLCGHRLLEASPATFRSPTPLFPPPVCFLCRFPNTQCRQV
jgi:hypothetical protein